MKTFIGVHSEAIGHFIRETEVLNHSIESHSDILKKKDVVLCTQKKISNTFFLRILRRSFRVWHWPFGDFTRRFLNVLSHSHRQKHDLFLDRNHESVLVLHESKSRLIDSKIESAIDLHFETHRREIGEENYRIFAIRDSGYDESNFKNFDPITQEYRNTPLSYFSPIFQLLDTSNVKILRVGRHNKTSIKTVFDKGIEISQLKCKDTDLCDFAMFSRATRVYSTGTGVDDVGLFLRKETIYLNLSPFGNAPKSPMIRAILASDYLDKRGRKIGLDELIERNLHKIRPVELMRQKEISVRQKEPDLLLKFVACIEEANESETGIDLVRKMSDLRLGEQWENVLY